MMSEHDVSAPVLDFEQISLHREANDIGDDVLADIGREMKRALQNFGFFYGKNHGISMESISSLMASAADFFEEPEECKIRHLKGEKGEFGWVRMESEKSNPELAPDLKESFNYHPADERNGLLKAAFSGQCKSVYSLCCELSYRLTDALSIALGFEKGCLTEPYQNVGKKDNQTFLRSLIYPAIPLDRKIRPGQLRLGEHTDYGMVTFLFQDDVGGLDMDTPSKGYRPVSPIPGTIVVFVGIQIQRLTADVLSAPKHRIVLSENETEARKRRQSLAFLVRADDNFVVKCLDGSKKYQPVSSVDYLDGRQTEVIA
ncbi:uncharacterized protein LOC123550945 [Mercenaria mercenaria]|uniref:uncharacterized protein LOC123550945 n=1 Tax=Mercenaria mercenaria TaxID=6596 RepID=UPI00234F1F00|nr:uncharacterized protein LOC123550945 [Mercenaria mercenaria]